MQRIISHTEIRGREERRGRADCLVLIGVMISNHDNKGKDTLVSKIVHFLVYQLNFGLP